MLTVILSICWFEKNKKKSHILFLTITSRLTIIIGLLHTLYKPYMMNYIMIINDNVYNFI